MFGCFTAIPRTFPAIYQKLPPKMSLAQLVNPVKSKWTHNKEKDERKRRDKKGERG